MKIMQYGLIFDVDGVIADTESLSSRVTATVFADLFDIHGVTYEDFNEGRGRGAEAYLKAAASRHNRTLTDEEVLRAETEREKRFLKTLAKSPLPAYPGVLELIHSAMKADDFRLAIATSSTRTKSRAVLTSAGVPFEVITTITGSDVTHKKPHPELFLTAAEQIDIPPERCLVIEDAPSGIEAALNAGCRCLAVTNSFPAPELAKAYRIVDSLKSVSIETVRGLINQG
jgi:beta-phosphoglucomutase